MRRLPSVLALSFATLSLLLASVALAVDAGARAPELGASDLGGNRVTIESLRGSVVIVDFWASWCRPCRSIMPALDGLHAAHHDEGLTVLGVAREPASRIRRHLAESPVGYTVGRDAGGTLARYGVRALPTLVLIDRRGLVREVFVGIDGGSMLGRLERLVTALLAEPPG